MFEFRCLHYLHAPWLLGLHGAPAITMHCVTCICSSSEPHTMAVNEVCDSQGWG